MKILYLEDSEPDAKLVSRYMQSVGHDFLVVDSIDEAWDVLQAERPDIFLCDIMIGDENAYELISQASYNKLAGHIVAVTAKTLPSERQHCLNIGCSWVITKPFTVDDLESTLDELG